MNNQDLQGSCEVLIGGLPVANALMLAMVAQNPSQLANGTAFTPLKAGYLPEGLLDTNVADFGPMQQEQGVPGGDTRDGNVGIQFVGNGQNVILNAQMVMLRYMADPAERQALINARAAQGQVAA